MRTGLRLEGPLFSLLATWNDQGHDRFGLAASRRVGGAVLRNRAKRLLRESFRRHRAETERGRDLVLLAKRELGACSQEEVDREYRERLGRLAARMWRRRAASPPDD
jgi:ribonuclease P protein component